MKGVPHNPLRSCVACRRQADKRELLRVIRTPQGAIDIDFSGKQNGRGAYLCWSIKCLEQAAKARKLDRALHTALSDETVQLIRDAIATRAKEADNQWQE